MTSRSPNSAPSTKVTLLALAVWFLATPCFLYLAFWNQVELFGAQPSDAELAQAKWWLAAAAVTGLGVPGWGFHRSWQSGDRWRPWVFGGAIALSVAAFVGWLAMVSV